MFDIPRGVILPVDRLDVRLDPAPHPFESENRAAVARHWARERAAVPALFNGTVVLLSRLAYRAGVLEGTCHAVSYAAFLYWRSLRPLPSAEHTFAHAMLAAGDGALVAIRMGPDTANAGRVYFAAGSFEPPDFPGGRVDIDLNMAREVREETGLDISGAVREARCQALSGEAGTVIFRRYRLDEDAGTIAARIRAFVAADSQPEIEAPVIIRGTDDLPEGLMPHMKPLVEWHFANP